MPRIDVHFRGQVQGVGFRATTHAIAQRYEVVGYVRNLPDGRVQFVDEGGAAELADFLQAVQSRLADYIRETTVDRSPGNGEFQRFEIRY